jgi:hypothetical protein
VPVSFNKQKRAGKRTGNGVASETSVDILLPSVTLLPETNGVEEHILSSEDHFLRDSISCRMG